MQDTWRFYALCLCIFIYGIHKLVQYILCERKSEANWEIDKREAKKSNIGKENCVISPRSSARLVQNVTQTIYFIVYFIPWASERARERKHKIISSVLSFYCDQCIQCFIIYEICSKLDFMIVIYASKLLWANMELISEYDYDLWIIKYQRGAL